MAFNQVIALFAFWLLSLLTDTRLDYPLVKQMKRKLIFKKLRPQTQHAYLDLTNATSQPTLDTLPAELMQTVFHSSSKKLNNLVAPLLYRAVEFDTPQDQHIFGDFTRRIYMTPLFHTKSLTFRNHWFDEFQVGHEELISADLCCLPIWNRSQEGNGDNRLSDTIYAYNKLVRAALKAIPKQQLNMFRSYSRFPVNGKIIEILLSQQNESLQQLRLFRLSDAPNTSDGLPSMNLQAIECRSLEPGPWCVNENHKEDGVIAFITDLIQTNSSTLRCLTIGHEAQILRRMYGDGSPSIEDEGEVLQALVSMEMLLSLSSLTLVGLNVDPTRSDLFSSAELVRQLAAIMPTDDQAERILLALSEFSFRYEAPERALIAALETFLARINPLVHLSVLLDNTRTMPKVEGFIQKHGVTLQCLVWEGRMEHGAQRTPVSLGYLSDENSEITAILRHCGKLKELGVPFNWQEMYVNSEYHESGFLKNTSIQTLHVRNSPTSTTRYTHIDNLTRAYATQFLDHAFNFPSSSVGAISQPNLQLLILGPLSYRQNWELQHDEGEHRTSEGIHQVWPVSRRPTLFHVGYTKVCGVGTYALVQEEFTNVRNVQDRFPARVLDSVWLLE